nr:MAG TPA: hypothetical protein [Caudoviricetes sp.]
MEFDMLSARNFGVLFKNMDGLISSMKFFFQDFPMKRHVKRKLK